MICIEKYVFGHVKALTKSKNRQIKNRVYHSETCFALIPNFTARKAPNPKHTLVLSTCLNWLAAEALTHK